MTELLLKGDAKHKCIIIIIIIFVVFVVVFVFHHENRLCYSSEHSEHIKMISTDKKRIYI